MMRSVSAHRIERWLGTQQCEMFSQRNRGWYGTPIPVAGVPGEVYLDGQGDFVGRLDAGSEGDIHQAVEDIQRAHRFRRAGWARKQGGGFAGLTELNAGITQQINFYTGGTVTVAGGWESLFKTQTVPPTGAAASAAPGGTVPTSATSGAPALNNAGGSRTLHYVSGIVSSRNSASTQGGAMLYDRIFAVSKTMNSTTTEAVTGTPSRYQNTVAGSVDSAENNFVFPETGGTALAATAHNWTVCTYTNQAGTAGQTLPSATGVSGASIGRVDLSANQWFMPLASGDRGIKALTQMQCSALVATGVLDFVIGHPIAFFPIYMYAIPAVVGGINSSFNLARIFDSACLAALMFGAAGQNTSLGLNIGLVEG